MLMSRTAGKSWAERSRRWLLACPEIVAVLFGGLLFLFSSPTLAQQR